MNWGSAPSPGIYRFGASMMQTGQPSLAAPFMLAPKSALEFHPLESSILRFGPSQFKNEFGKIQ